MRGKGSPRYLIFTFDDCILPNCDMMRWHDVVEGVNRYLGIPTLAYSSSFTRLIVLVMVRVCLLLDGTDLWFRFTM